MKNLFMFFILFFFLIDISFSQTNNFNTEKFQYISPVPGSKLILPQNNIIIREGEPYTGINLNDTTLIEVFGSISGKHSGSLYLTDDQKTLIFLPTNPFIKSEIVTANLRSGLKTISNKDVDSLSFQFKINEDSSQNLSSLEEQYISATSSPNLLEDFPKFKIQSLNNPGAGKFFMGTNYGSTGYLSIIDNSGNPLFFRKVPGRAFVFELQKNGLVTYFDNDKNKFYGLNNKYEIVDSFTCGNGYVADWHDIEILPNNHVFLVSYDNQKINMSNVVTNGDTNATVTGCVIQEIDENGIVVWQWRTWDHFNITDADSIYDLTLPSIKYSHVNAFNIVDDNKLLISSRNMNEITLIDRNTGKMVWRFGGKNNQFTTNDPVAFYGQHGIKAVDNGNIIFFDNGQSFLQEYSRAVEYKIDSLNKSASLVFEYDNNESIWGKVMGSIQRLTNGNTLIGWGNAGANKLAATELHPNGSKALEILFDTDLIHFNYRVLKFPWKTNLFTTNIDTLNFSNVSAGDSLIKSVTINNNSDKEISITSFYNSNTSFSTIDTLPIVIPANGNSEINVKFKPSSSNEMFDSLYIRSEKTDEMIAQILFLSGNKEITAIKEDAVKISNFSLSQNYPNPFNPSTVIRYTIPNAGTSLMKFLQVQLKIYDILGNEITTLVNKQQSPGNYEVEFDANSLSSGIYFYQLKAGNFIETKKMILLR